jgi:hypothetical protein
MVFVYTSDMRYCFSGLPSADHGLITYVRKYRIGRLYIRYGAIQCRHTKACGPTAESGHMRQRARRTRSSISTDAAGLSPTSDASCEDVLLFRGHCIVSAGCSPLRVDPLDRHARRLRGCVSPRTELFGVHP